MVTKLGEVFKIEKFEPPSDEDIARWSAEGSREETEFKRAQELERRKTRVAAIRCTDAMRTALINSTFIETEAVKRAREWYAKRDKPWLVLSGPTGCGKSMAAAVIPVENCTAVFVRADEVVRLFSSMFGDQYEQQQKLRDAPLLVVDDLGCEFDATRMLPALLDLLDARQSASKHPTIVTTNLTPQAFRERYTNDRLNGRMAELVRWEGVTTEDLRRRK